MLHVDVLSGFQICGAGSLVGAALLGIADTSDERTQRALRQCIWGFVVLGLGLVPAGLGEALVHPAAQFTLGFGSLCGVLLIGSGVGEVQGKGMSLRAMALMLVACAAALGWTLAIDLRRFGICYA